MKKNYALSIILSSALLVLSGCGSSSNSTSNVDNSTQTKQNSTTSTADNQNSDSVNNQSSSTSSILNSTPVATLENISTNSDVPYNGQLTASDSDNDNLTYDLSSQPEHGTLVVNKNGTFSYTPDNGYIGRDNFSYIVKDDRSACPAKNVSIEVSQKPITIPNPPSNLRLEALSTCKIKVSWDDNSDNETGFDIFLDDELIYVEKENAVTTNICGHNMQPASTHTVEVLAKNEAGWSDSIVSEVTTQDITEVPFAPTNLKILAVDKTSARLTWDDNAWSESSYELYRDGVFIKELPIDCDYVIVDDLEAGSSYDFVIKAVNKIGSTSSNTITVATKAIELEKDYLSLIPIDSNLELGPKGFVYYVDPRPEENGHNRALKINYLDMSFQEVAVDGINPHSLDRAGDSDKFYIRTQNSNSFDVISFEQGKVLKTVDLVDHKPRAIGATNLKHNLQLLSARDMAVVDVIDTTSDEVIATLGDKTPVTTTTGHATWFDLDHFALIDRANKKVVIYKVVDNGESFDFIKTDEKVFKSSFHTIERVSKPLTKDDLVTFYSTGEGDVSKGIPPYVNELKFDPTTGTITSTREVSLDKSTAKVVGVSPITHHAGTSPDGKYFIVPVFDGNVYIIDRKSFKVVKTIKAALGAAHIEFSQKYDIAIITNHFSNELTFLDMKTLKVTKRLTLSKTQYFDPDPAHADHRHLLQPHFSYIGLNGDYFYTFATQDGDFLKINLETLEIEDTLHVGGAPEQAHS